MQVQSPAARSRSHRYTAGFAAYVGPSGWAMICCERLLPLIEAPTEICWRLPAEDASAAVQGLSAGDADDDHQPHHACGLLPSQEYFQNLACLLQEDSSVDRRASERDWGRCDGDCGNMSQKSHRDSIAVNVDCEGEGEDESSVPIGQHLDTVPRTQLRKTASGDTFGLSSCEIEPDPDNLCLLVHSKIYAVRPAWGSVCRAVPAVASATWPPKLCLALFCFAGSLPDKLPVDDRHSRLCLQSAFRDLFVADCSREASLLGQTIVVKGRTHVEDLVPIVHLAASCWTSDDRPS